MACKCVTYERFGDCMHVAMGLNGWYFVTEGRTEAGDKYWDDALSAWLPVTGDDLNKPITGSVIRKQR